MWVKITFAKSELAMGKTIILHTGWESQLRIPFDMARAQSAASPMLGCARNQVIKYPNRELKSEMICENWLPQKNGLYIISRKVSHISFIYIAPPRYRGNIRNTGLLRAGPSFRGSSLFVGGDTQEGLVKINVARRAELPRYKFVRRWRCREGLVKINVARRAELPRYKFVRRWRCREGLVKSNVARRAELLSYNFVCRWRCREGLVKSNVARRTERSR